MTPGHYYIIIRLWAPPEETERPEVPVYVRRLDTDGKVNWTTTRDWQNASYFKSQKTAERILNGVARIRARIEHGWFYEIIKVSEETIATNLPLEEALEIAKTNRPERGE